MDNLKITELYESGLSVAKIAAMLNSTPTKVNNVLKKEGVSKRKFTEINKRYSFNENFFETIDSEEKAYWLGFIAADGCVHINSYVKKFSLALAAKDKDHLELFIKSINATHPLRLRKGKRSQIFPSYVVTLHSLIFINSLTQLGIVPRKSLILKPPIISKDLRKHWVRGYFDGDGSYSEEYHRYSITGTREILHFILQETYLRNVKIRPLSDSKAFTIRFSRLSEVKRFSELIYQEATIMLKRKECLLYR